MYVLKLWCDCWRLSSSATVGAVAGCTQLSGDIQHLPSCRQSCTATACCLHCDPQSSHSHSSHHVTLLLAVQASGNADGSSKLDKMLSFWRDKGVFDQQTISRFTHEMQSGNASALLLANYPPAAPPQPPQPAPQQPQVSGWGPTPGGTPPQPPQAPVSGGWGPPPPGAPSPHMAAAGQPGSSGWGPPVAFQQQQQQPGYPQQPMQQQGGWGAPQPPPPGPWGPPAPPPAPPAYPGAGVPPQYAAAAGVPPAGPPPGQYPGAVAQPYPPAAAVPPGVPHPGGMVLPAGQAVQQPGPPPVPQPEPLSSLAFPPGLIPQLSRDKSKYSEPYASIEPAEIDKAGLPPPPEKDAYLKSRMEKFMLEVSAYLGRCYQCRGFSCTQLVNITACCRPVGAVGQW